MSMPEFRTFSSIAAAGAGRRPSDLLYDYEPGRRGRPLRTLRNEAPNGYSDQARRTSCGPPAFVQTEWAFALLSALHRLLIKRQTTALVIVAGRFSHTRCARIHKPMRLPALILSTCFTSASEA
jgi:hypothetical protein